MRRLIPQLDGPDLDAFPSEVRRVSEADPDRPHEYRVWGGYLEKVLDDKKSPVRPQLVWKNFYYGSRHKKVIKNFPSRWSAGNPAHYLDPEAFTQLDELVKLSKPVRDYFQRQRTEAEG
jgi:hypothetical protein